MNIFQTETEDIIENVYSHLEQLKNEPTNIDLQATLYREMHSLKGAIRMVGFANIQMIIHKIEDIFDDIKMKNIKLSSDEIHIIVKAVESVSDLLRQSVDNKREIVGQNFTAIISSLETMQITLQDDSSLLESDSSDIEPEQQKVSVQEKEEFNIIFNKCFELIDDIVPEEENSDVVILIEELTKIYDKVKTYNMYEVKNSLQNVITKLDFVSHATGGFTISEILEMRNELSSAAAKFNTFCLDEVPVETTTFFDIAEKMNMLQSSSVYAQEIKNSIAEIKSGITDNCISEIVNITEEILDFIIENSVQLEEQMAQTLKSAIEYCASPNEGIDGDLIIQQLEIMKQLLELNFKNDTGVNEIKNLSAQSSIVSKSSIEIKTLHVNAQKLDLLVNLLGELIITKIRSEKNHEKIAGIKGRSENCQKNLLKTANYLRYYKRKYLQGEYDEQYFNTFVRQTFSLFSNVTQELSKMIYDLDTLYRSSKEDDMKVRMIIDEMESMVKNIRVLPISTVFNSFSRMVRDIAMEKGKDIDFEIQSNDTCADKKIIEEIKTPLMHILRNAIDHGIETKEDRIMAGKSMVGKILLSAKQDDNKIIIDVIDDGQGFNLEKIKTRAVARGFLTQEDINAMTDEAIMNIIFWPGFTTGDSITSVSGRGIGLDVVKTKISQLNGKVKVISEFGKGSCVHIEIPVALATLRVFLVEISEQVFAIPIQVITTFVLKKQDEIKTGNNGLSIVYNDKILPLYYLSDILGLKQTQRSDKETVLIIEADEKSIALVVDKLLGDQDILQKKLPAPLYKVKNISGVTNLASGELCLILNMQDIMHYDFRKTIHAVQLHKSVALGLMDYKNILVVDDSVTTRIMLKNILSNAGFNYESVESAKDALAKLKANQYDLIITDLAMENMDGYEFISVLNNDETYADIPIVVISATSQEVANAKLKDFKYECFIKKEPFNQEEFIDTVRDVLIKYHES